MIYDCCLHFVSLNTMKDWIHSHFAQFSSSHNIVNRYTVLPFLVIKRGFKEIDS